MVITFLLRDSGEIYGTYDSLDLVYNTLLQIVYIRYKYHKKDSIASCNVQNMLNSFQILEYHTNMVKNVYTVGMDYYLYDQKKNICVMNSVSIHDYIAKLTSFVEDEQYACDDLGIFLPVEDTEKTNAPQTNEIMELEAKLELLESNKKKELNKYKELESITEKKTKELIKKKVKTNSTITDLKHDKKLYQEKRTKFIADYEVFLRVEDEMNKGQRNLDDVPIIFEKSYNILKEMREKNLINNDIDEMFDYFISHIERSDFYNGEYNTIFDAPTFEELKKFCPSDSESDSGSESDDELESSESSSNLVYTESTFNSDSDSDDSSEHETIPDNFRKMADTLISGSIN